MIRRRERREVKRIVKWRWNGLDDCREFMVVFKAEGNDRCQAKWIDEETLLRCAAGKFT